MTDWTLIPPEGKLDAKLVLIGEAGGENEARLKRPFVGASGHKLNSWWHPLGLRRADFYIDNVFPFHPPGNDFAALLASDYLHVHEWANNLHDRLAALVDPHVIVPTGNVALRALMRVNLDDTAITISKYRGSVLEYVNLRGRSIKVIPTIHPASIYHQRAKKARGQEKSNPGRTEKHCVMDWEKIAREAQTRDIDAPAEHYYIVDEIPDLDFWRAEFDALGPDVPVNIDIETPHDAVDVVGFSWSPQFALAIPLAWPGYGPEHPSYAARRALIEHICASPNPKVLQNGPFDTWWLHFDEQITVRNYCYDLMEMHHCLDPVDDHDLGYMISRFMRRPYHKNDSDGTYESCLTYNCKDGCTQIALFYILQEELMKAGRWELYERSFKPLIPVLNEMMLTGINTSRLARRIGNAQLRARTIELQDALAAHVGYKLHAKVGLSRKLVMKYLYEDLGLPPQRTRASKGEPPKKTINEVAKRKLQLKFPAPHPAGVAIGLMLEHERVIKLASFLTDQKTDDDGRLRSEIRALTEAARCSSKKNTWGTGTNIQNQDRDERVRSSFIPDYDDHVFLEVDCSQAESRIVYVLSGDDDLYNLAVLPPDKFDTHSYNAHLVFGSVKSPTDIFKKRVLDTDLTTVLGYVSQEQRYFGKRVEHGAQRGMGGETMSNNLLMDEVVRTPEECARMLERYMRAKPGVGRYFEWVRGQVLRNKSLTNSWGFEWNVRFEKMDQDLYRRAYSFLPQSEVAFILNVLGLVPVAQHIKSYFTPRQARVVTQVHDSVLISVQANPKYIVGLMRVLHENLTQTRVYQTRSGPRELAMPIEWKLGRNWAFPEGIEWKKVPTLDEVASALESVRGRHAA